ncbi:MAG: response regulator, partial [Rhodospirillaceae bacterium]|nr:response regulator [Rhodospirillaceae bacterium]
REGFGSQLIRGALRRTRLSFEPAGLRCEFVLRLARDQANRTRLPPPVPPARPVRLAPPSLAGLRVLIVEDEPLAAMEMRLTLEAAGAVVAGMAATLGEALALAETPVSAAVMDVNLNGEMVYPAAERMVARGVPVVLATGYDTLTVTIPDVLGGVPVLQKPVAPQSLVACLAELTADARKAAEAAPPAGVARGSSRLAGG